MKVAKAMGSAPQLQYLPARKEVIHAFASHDKVRRHFGDLMRNVPLENGLQKMASWVRKHGSKKTVMFTNIEIEKNLPESWR